MINSKNLSQMFNQLKYYRINFEHVDTSGGLNSKYYLNIVI